METSHVFFTAPGPVSALMAQPMFASIVLTWSAPQEPNGVLISYEVTYRVNDCDPCDKGSYSIH